MNEALQSHPSDVEGVIRMPDETSRSIKMPEDLWRDLQFLWTVEGIKEEDLVPQAIEEMKLQPGGISFDYAFSIVVHSLASRWQ